MSWALAPWITKPEFLIGTLIGILGVVVGIIGLQRGSPTKRVDYRVSTNDPIVGAAGRQVRSRRLAVTIDGRPVEEPRVLTLRLQNTGRVGIGIEDYVKPIAIRLPGGTPVSADPLLQSEPGLLAAHELNAMGDAVQLTPKLLNPKQWVDVQIIFENGSGSPVVTCSGKNFAKPRELTENVVANVRSDVGVAASFALILAGLAFGLSRIPFVRQHLPLLIEGIQVILVTVLLILVLTLRKLLMPYINLLAAWVWKDARLRFLKWLRGTFVA